MCPPDTKQWTNAGLMLIRRRRGWPNINPSLISVSIVYWLTLCDIYLHYSIDAYTVFRKLENIYLLSYCTMDHNICLSTVQYGLSTILAKMSSRCLAIQYQILFALYIFMPYNMFFIPSLAYIYTTNTINPLLTLLLMIFSEICFYYWTLPRSWFSEKPSVWW